jgi:hypothetical protein
MNNSLDNDLVFICVISSIVCLTTGYYIKSKFLNSSVIETPNSPRTFNLTPDQLQELKDILDLGDILDKENQDKLDPDFANILGKEDYDNFNQEIPELEDIFQKVLEDLLNSL